MKISGKQKATHREAILTAASRQFREKGLDGVSVADLMKAAGLTHGGFYNHFVSKEELIALSAGNAFEQTAKRWYEKPFEAIVESYLSEQHYLESGTGCPVATLGPEAARLGSEIKTSMSEGIEVLIAILEASVSGQSKRERRKHAVVALSGMVGAMILARCSGSISGPDEFLNTLSEFLRSTNEERKIT